MEGLKHLAIAAAIAALFVAGCSKEPTSEGMNLPDPYAKMTPQQKIDAIRNDPKINAMQKSSMISDAQKAAGLPVTGQ